MPKLSLWNSGRKSNDFKFIDGSIKEYFDIGGTAAYVHKYLGTYDEKGNPTVNQSSIQDMLFLENRDRVYDKDILELRGIYNVQDSDFDLKQFNIFLSNDDLYVEFHMNSMIAILGRKLMSGDVVELPHQREDAFLDENTPAANKYYVISDANRASSGYSQTWYPHVWRVKCSPLTDAQEYRDILDRKPEDMFGMPLDSPLFGNVRDIMSTLGKEQGINEAVVEEAKLHVSKRNFDTTHFYVVSGDDKQDPWIYAGDGVPPNGATLSGNGSSYPLDAKDNDYFLRTDYEPHVLFQKKGTRWNRIELDYRKQDWSMAHRLLDSFINNKTQTTFTDGSVVEEKQALSKVIKPKTDF